MLPSAKLREYGGRLVRFNKDQLLFEQGDTATEYFQIEEGQVKMFILNEDGQEFMQGIFKDGESFGEPPIFGDFAYPSSAIGIEAGRIWRMSKVDFFRLLRDNFELHLKINKVLCERLQYKSMILTEISAHNPEHRLTTILDYFKSKIGNNKPDHSVLIPFTRQQLADMTGLRVETVIRTIKKMEHNGKLELEDHKIRY